MYQCSTADGIVRFTTPLHLMGLNSFGFLDVHSVLLLAAVMPMFLIIYDLRECLKKKKTLYLRNMSIFCQILKGVCIAFQRIYMPYEKKIFNEYSTENLKTLHSKIFCKYQIFS